jgi:hypothetical protein
MRKRAPPKRGPASAGRAPSANRTRRINLGSVQVDDQDKAPAQSSPGIAIGRARRSGARPEPAIELQDGRLTRAYRAREVFGDEKALWWRGAVDAYPDYAHNQRKTDRHLPVFLLGPVSWGTPAGDGSEAQLGVIPA